MRWGITAALVAALAQAAPAAAQDGAEVGRAGDAVLTARTAAGEGLCLTLRTPRDSRDECAPFPLRIGGPLVVEARGAVGIAVAAQVAAVEVVPERGAPVRAATTEPAGSPAPGTRFAVVPAGTVRRVRLIDREGRLLVAVAPDGPEAFFARRGTTRPLGRSGGVALRVRRTTVLAPTLREPEREERQTCIAAGSHEACVSDLVPGSLSLGDASEGCRRPRTVVFGLAARDVRTVVAVLGDGSRARTRTIAVPGARLRAYALRTGLAVRTLTALAAGGRRLGITPAGIAPPRPACGPGGSASGSSFGIGLTGDRLAPPTAGAEVAPGVVASDRGEALCVGPGEEGCTAPTLEFQYLRGLRRPDGTLLVVGAVPALVARVSVQTDGGAVEAATLAGDAYRGRWAGHVRFVAVVLPAGARAERATLLDADGGVVERTPVVGRPRLVAAPRPAGRLAGRPLSVARIDTGDGETFPCLLLGPAPRGLDALLHRCASGLGGLEVSCARRTTELLTAVPAGVRAIELRLRGGRRVVARPRTVAGVRFVAVATGAREGVRSIVVRRGAGSRAATVGLPPPAEQCGYTARLLELAGP